MPDKDKKVPTFSTPQENSQPEASEVKPVPTAATQGLEPQNEPKPKK